MTVSAVVWRHASVRAHNSSRANITKRPSTPGSLPLRRRPMCWGTPPSSGFVSIVVAAQGAVIDKSRRTEPGSRRKDAGPGRALCVARGLVGVVALKEDAAFPGL
jgi:hypothetical protein